ncbi:GroES-like protein [Thelephora terrestris]|uniref:GroES-like protein n=1 Tax=Thelephora terrestris TaxID=56493 RepID=A0A9P6HH16_9AGAM|nr:GroES-like protein [Thelephora terrestris]
MSVSSEIIPSTCKALVQEGKDIVLEETPTPAVGENEVLFRVRAIGLDPIDVTGTSSLFFPTEGAHIGCDFTGEVVKLGPNLKVDLKAGDKVSATIVGNFVGGRGAFVQYAKTFSDIVWMIPEGTLLFEQAAATASPLNTAFQALYGAKELGLTQHFDSVPPKGTENTWVFVYGGSSGVGQFAIQFAKLSGYKAVASPRNHELLKSLGADAFVLPPVDTFTLAADTSALVFVKDVAGNSISHAFDTIAGNHTQITAVKVLAEHKPGKVIAVLPLAEGIHDVRKDVRVKMIDIFCSYGFGHVGLGPDDDARGVLSAFLQKVPELVQDGKLKCIPGKKFDGGLEKVVSDGFW